MLHHIDNDSIIMPKSDLVSEKDDATFLKLGFENQIRNIRSRKLTPRVMPSLPNIKMSGSIEVIQEQDIEAENNSGELECKDGTFLLPKLNKTEIAPKEVYKSKGIKIDLRHHNFENEPLPTDDECISKVKLGKILYDVNDDKKSKNVAKKKVSRKISKGSDTLVLVVEEVPKVEIDVLCA